MNTRPKGRQNQQTRLYKPYIHRGRGRGHRNFPSMTEADEIIDKYHITGIEEALLLLGPHPEEIIFQKDCIEGNINIIIKVTIEEGPKFHHGHPVETMKDVLAVYSLTSLLENVWRRIFL